jgi:P-type Cu2+ transporter
MSISSLAPTLAAPIAGEVLHLLDDPHEWSAFSRPMGQGTSVWESNIVVQGMHCAACSLNVEGNYSGHF